MSGAIYNELDAYPAAWLRNLIAAQHIAAGVVDERSIVELVASDVAGPGQRHFFAGIGVWSYALRLAGVPDDADIWTASCPCQPFSGAGLRRGTADERHLWPVLRGLVKECRPAILFGEQVASRDGRAWLAAVRADLESLGYAVGAADLCAASVGAPHIRQRLYFVAYAGCNERGPRRTSEENGERALESTRRGDACRLAHDASIGRLKGFDEREATPDDRARSADDRGAGRLGDPGSARSWRYARTDARAEAAREGSRIGTGRVRDELGAAGATRDPWSACDWIPCSDGKSRPVEPGAFPLAHGVAGRVGRLRAYGNAIVAAQAATFVKAAIAAIRDNLII